MKFKLFGFLLIFSFLNLSCSSVGKNKLIREFSCNGSAKTPHRLTYIKGQKEELLSPTDQIYDPLPIKLKKFVFEKDAFRAVGETALGSVLVAFKKEGCDIGADNLSPYICTFTIGGLKRYGCGEVTYFNE